MSLRLAIVLPASLGRPLVNVPVLSKATESISAMRSKRHPKVLGA